MFDGARLCSAQRNQPQQGVTPTVNFRNNRRFTLLRLVYDTAAV
jgi:hypothetical protein